MSCVIPTVGAKHNLIRVISEGFTPPTIFFLPSLPEIHDGAAVGHVQSQCQGWVAAEEGGEIRERQASGVGAAKEAVTEKQKEEEEKGLELEMEEG